jgi:hypothetical protein
MFTTRALHVLGVVFCLVGCTRERPSADHSMFGEDTTVRSKRARTSGSSSKGEPLLQRINQKDTALPTYDVLPLAPGEHIQIDGRLDEAVWRTTAVTRPFVLPTTGQAVPANAPLGGTAQLRYDENNLYIAIEAKDVDVSGNFDQASVDPHLWTRDTVEVMLDPEGDGDNRDYYEIQVNPQGLVFDSQFDRYNEPRVLPDGPFGHQEWSSTLAHAVTVKGTLNDPSDRDDGYIVEMALPFSTLTKVKTRPPKPGIEWRANFYVMQENGGVSWSPILYQGNFHKASRFGRLRFGS